MRYLIKNIKYPIFIFIAFLSTAYILSEITKVFQKKQVVGLTYKESTIKDFIMAGVGEENFYLKGTELIDKKSVVQAFNIEFEYRKTKTPIFLKSKYANILLDKKIVQLRDDLFIRIGAISIMTPTLNIYLDKKIAKNNENVVLKSNQKIYTTGKNLYIDINTNTLKLENVKTVIRGS